MERITFKEVLDHVSNLLNCKNRTIASLIGVQESTLSANNTKLLSDVSTKKAGKRLIRLTEVTLHFSELGLNSQAIMLILTDPVHENDDGFYESIKDIILMEKYDRSVLIEIGNKAYTKYVEFMKKANTRFLKQIQEELQAV